jgi:mono/diheme cytochrome c family protein
MRLITAIPALTALAIVALPAMAQMDMSAGMGDPDRGEAIYLKRCVWCHGDEGDGLGPAADRMNPPPRDFTLGQYKMKSTVFSDDYASDDDIHSAIHNGMSGTAMPGWADMLSEQDMMDLVIYLKMFAGLEEEEPGAGIDYGSPVETSEQSIAEGKRLFHDGDRCSECHGQDGRGDAIKRLKGDNGERTWPRNLTKPWTFRASTAPKDIFSRISAGIPGTQMPNFADPKSKKKLTIEERWHVANYVASLSGTGLPVRAEKTVIKAARLDGALPDGPDDPRWAEAELATFYLVPQIIAKERFFTPSNDTIGDLLSGAADHRQGTFLHALERHHIGSRLLQRRGHRDVAGMGRPDQEHPRRPQGAGNSRPRHGRGYGGGPVAGIDSRGREEALFHPRRRGAAGQSLAVEQRHDR